MDAIIEYVSVGLIVEGLLNGKELGITLVGGFVGVLEGVNGFRLGQLEVDNFDGALDGVVDGLSVGSEVGGRLGNGTPVRAA